MAIASFRAFKGTVTQFVTRMTRPSDRWLADPKTGAIVGIESPTANGADARFVPVDITQQQADQPSSLMLANLDAVYRLNVAPYTRYVSDGDQLVTMGANENVTIISPGINQIFYSPLTIATPQELIVMGGLHVQAYPA